MNTDNYDLYDETISEWYSRVASSGYHNQTRYVSELLHIMPKGSSILELGCGTGDILIPLTEEGRTCEGVDKSQEMLAKLHLRHSHIVTYPFDVREFIPETTYDFVLSCNGVFSIKGNELESYLLEQEEVTDCLRRYAALSRNGVVVNRGKDKDGIRLPINGVEFIHRELREGNMMVRIHLLFDRGKFMGDRTHVKRRYSLEKMLRGAKFQKLTELFCSITF